MLAIVRAPVHSNYSKGRNLIKKAVATALVIKIMTPNATQSSSSKTESDCTLDDAKDKIIIKQKHTVKFTCSIKQKRIYFFVMLRMIKTY